MLPLLLGCAAPTEAPSPSDDTAADTTPADTSGDDTGAGDTGADETDLPDGYGRLSGFIDGPEDVRIDVLADYCIALFPDKHGHFELTAPAGLHSLQLTNGDAAYASPLTVIDVVEGTTTALDTPIQVPAFTHTAALASGDFDAGGGLTITADEATYDHPYGDFYAPGLAAVAVDVADSGLPLETLTGTPLAMWYLGTSGAALTAPWPIRIDGALGLKDGARVRLMQPWHDGVAVPLWVDVGGATVSSGALISDDGDGIRYLTTLVVVAE